MRYTVFIMILISIFVWSGCGNDAENRLDIVATGARGKEMQDDTENKNGDNTATGNTINISLIVDNANAGFYTPPFIEEYKTLVPLRDVAEGAGYKVDFDDDTSTATLTKTESLLKIPLDSEDPYVDGKTHQIVLAPGSDTVFVDGSEIPTENGARLVEGQIVVPLRFFSEIMDMDVIWSEDGIGVLNGYPGALINTRLRGSAPLAGVSVFRTVSPDIISAVDNEGNAVTLGMDVADMQKSIGYPKLVWGRGIPAPQLSYEYADEISSIEDMGNAYAEISCSLGTVTVIQLGPGSGDKMKTGTGVAVGDSAESIAKAYNVSESYMEEQIDDNRITLFYAGDTLISDYSNSDITHVVNFMILDNGKIEVIAIADMVSARELSAPLDM